MNFVSKKLSLVLLLSFAELANGQTVFQPNFGIGASNSRPFAPNFVTPFRPVVRPNTNIFGPTINTAAPASGWFTPNSLGAPTPTFQPITPSFGFSWNYAGASEPIDLVIDQEGDSGNYSIDNFFGCEVTDEPFNLEIVNPLDFNRCFQSNSVIAANHISRLQDDVRACKCLSDSPVADVKRIMKLSIGKNDIIDEDLRARKVYQSSLDHVINGVAFQAGVLAQRAEPADREKFVKEYSQNPFPYNPSSKKVVLKGENGEMSLNLPSNVNPRLGRDDIPYPSIVESNGETVPVCISMVAFHRMRQMPSPREWPSLLSEMESYSPASWNYSALQERYDSIMRQSLISRTMKVAEIMQIKAKLSFLNRNPLMKYFLGADANDLSKVTGNGSEYLGTTFNLQGKQNELFSLMSGSLKKPECRNAETAEACGAEFREKLRGFFGSADSALIGDISREQMRKDIQARATRASRMLEDKIPEQQLNQPEMLTRFQTQFGIEKPANCGVLPNHDNVDETTETCLKKMSAYCNFIEPHEAQILEREDSGDSLPITDTLASELDDDFNTDPSTNEAFKEANKNFCHTPFAKKDGSKEETFFDFLGGYCATPSNPGCARTSAADWDTLRAKFKEDYVLESRRSGAQGDDQGDDHDILTSDVTTEGKDSGGAGGATSGVTGGGFGGGSYDPNCKRFCLGGGSRRESSDAGSVATIDNSKKPVFAGSTDAVKEGGTAATKTAVVQTPDPVFSGNYQTDFSTTAPGVVSGQTNLASRDVQEQIVNQLQQKVDEVAEANPNSPDLRALQADLAAIRAAFAQSQVANKSLTDKIAALEKAQDIITRNEIVPGLSDRPVAQASRGRSPSSVPNPRVSLGELDRTISSVRENQNTGSVTNGAQVSGNAGRGRVSGGSDSSSDAIRREEAKLINVDNSVDGSLTITTNPRASGVQANGVSVEVPMTLYQTISANPEGIDLSQIRIPQEQMSQVQNGEFTLLVNSGDGNPPFKVQVQIKNNRLVRADSNEDGRPDREVQTVRLNDLNLIFRPIIQASR